MSFVATLFQPFLAFLGTYKWYILIFILLYLALTIVFRHSRELITVVFGTLIIIFVITHLGDVYVLFKAIRNCWLRCFWRYRRIARRPSRFHRPRWFPHGQLAHQKNLWLPRIHKSGVVC